MNTQPKVLIVDDEPDTRIFVVALLKRQNYNLTTVSSGEDALVFLENNHDVDIMLLDIMMPTLDGFEVLEIIKSDPKTSRIKVIMLTATNRVKDKVRAFSLGASDYLVKPFERGELIARIETQFRLKQTTATLANSEAKYRTIIDHANDAIMVLKEFKVIFVNQVIEKILGYSKENFLSLELEQLFPAEILPSVLNQYQRGFSGKDTTSIYALEMMHCDGHRVPLEISATLIDYEGEQATLIIARDIGERKEAEEKIGALARFASEAPNPILRISPQGKVMFSNMPGIDLLHNNRQNKISTNAPQSWLPFIRQTLETDERIEVEHLCNDRVFTCIFVPVGALGYVNVYGTDITERIKAEHALRDSEEHHRMLAENASDLITRLATDGTYTYVSAACREILEFEPEELLGQSFFDFIHPEDLEEILQMDPPLLDPDNESIFTLRFQKKNKSYIWLESSIRRVQMPETGETQMVAVARDVTERKRYETALQQAYDELEQRVAERTRDLSNSNILLKQVIAERKQAEAKIIKFNQELLTLQYAGAAIASSLDLHYVLQTVTREMVAMLKVEGCAISEWNHSTDEISLVAKYGPDNWWNGSSLVDPTLAKEVLLRREYNQISSNTQTPLKSNIKTLLILPMIFQDHEIGCVEIVDSRRERAFTNQEISLAQLLSNQAASAIENARLFEQAQQELVERKKVEQELEKERATLARRVEERTAELSTANSKLARAARLKNEFLASMSHELRTPLNAVLSMSEALQEEVYGGLNQKQNKAIKNIEDSGRHLLSLINDILDLSKIEAGKFQLQIDTVSVKRVCQASLLFVKQIAHKKRIKVSSTIDKKATMLQADERRLKQVLVNLLSNAVKFTPEGGKIGLDVVKDDAQQAIHFTVWDTGIGIPEDRMTRLFQPFVQLDSALSRRYAGTGLGLALVRRMAEMHGGSVSLESELDKGSRFTVSLPWSPVEEQPNGKDAFSGSGSGQQPTNRQAMVVEDSPVVADQYKRYLKELGLETIIHPQGNGAVDKAASASPDVIILDILLPDMTGWDVLTGLKANPTTKNIPVVVASVMDEQAQSKTLGATDYLLKPISRRRLQQSLHNIFNKPEPDSPLFKISAKSTTTPPANLQQGKPAEKPLILLADDHEMNLNTLSDYLLNTGYRVVTARTGKEAIARAKEEPPNLILMDIQMPEMDGLEAMERLRSQKQFKTTPIIAITALAMPGDRERCLTAGANDYMSKPISLKGLVKLIKFQLTPTEP